MYICWFGAGNQLQTHSDNGFLLQIQIAYTNLLSLQSIPIVFSICHNFVHSTLSKAFSKSTKHMNSSLSCSKLLSQSILITPIASLLNNRLAKVIWPLAFIVHMFA